MIRPVLTEIVLFLTPFVLYAVFLWTTQAGVMDFKSWPLLRVATLAIAALVLVLGSFIFLRIFTAPRPGRTKCPRIMRTAR